MKTKSMMALSMVGGVALGAIAVHGLQAQARPPVYYVAEIQPTNIDGYTNDYAPKAQAAIKEAGGRYVVASSAVKGLDGAPPTGRVVILQWKNAEQLDAWRKSAAYLEARKVGDKYATFRAFAVEGVAE